MKKIILTILTLIIGVAAYAQQGSIAYETLADSLFVHHHYQRAVDFYQKALKKSQYPGDIMLQLAKCYYNMNLITESENWFVKGKQHGGSFTTQDYYQFARVLTILKKIHQADTLLEHVLQHDPDNIVARKTLDDLRNFE